MEFIRQIERLQLLNKLVREKRTGSPQEFAERLGVSRAKLYLMLDELKDEGVEIRFCKKIKSFCFKKGKIILNFSYEILPDEELQNLDGGLCEIQLFRCLGIYFEPNLID